MEAFLSAHPNAKIITDTKESLTALARRVLSSPQKDQFLLQTYSLDDVDWLAEQDPKVHSILTLYKLGLQKLDIEQLFWRRDKLAGITMPISWTRDHSLLRKITPIEPPVYLHGKP